MKYYDIYSYSDVDCKFFLSILRQNKPLLERIELFLSKQKVCVISDTSELLCYVRQRDGHFELKGFLQYNRFCELIIKGF